MINIPTELLRTLVAVVDARSFTKAARELGVTQPAVSAQIKRLQLLLDCELFDRSAPGVTLNASGEQVLDQARRLLKINDRIVGISAPQSGLKSLRIGVTGDFSAPLLPPILTRFKRPDLRFLLHCHSFEAVSQAWLQGGIDLFVAVSDNAIPLEARYEWREPMVWVRGRDFLLDIDAPVPLVTFGESCAFHRVATTALNAARRSYEMVFKGPSEATNMEAVRAGLGIGMVPRSRAAASGCEVCPDPMLPRMSDLHCGIYVSDNDEQSVLDELADALYAECQSKLRRSVEEAVAA